MNMEQCVSEMQRRTICNLIANQQRKKVAISNPSIYKEKENDCEFWINFAKEITDKLIINGYFEGYKLSSMGLIQGNDYNLQLTDDFNKKKFHIYSDGSVSNAMDYTPETGINLDGFQIFLLIMIAVYFIAFIITLLMGSLAVLVVIILGIINICIFWDS